MKIKFVNRCIGMLRGGGEQFDLNIARELQRLGCKVSFVVGRPLFRKVKYSVKEFPTEYLASPYLRDFSQKLEMMPFPLRQIGYRLYNFDSRAFSKKAISFLVKKNDCDILQASGLSFITELKKRKKIPVVLCFPGPPWIGHKELIQRADVIVANGESINEITKNFRKDAISILPGVDHNLFKPVKNNIREKYSINNNEKLLLFTGRLVPLKNLPFLIRTLAEVVTERENVKLLIVGEGPLEKQTRAWVRKLKVEGRAIFTGRVRNEELPQYYSVADIFVMSSTYENFPNAILEAMSCELPIVATRVGGILMEIKDGVNGFLVESGNVEQFKKKIIFLLDNKSLAEEIGKRNRQEVKEKYSWLESAKKLNAVYDSLL